LFLAHWIKRNIIIFGFLPVNGLAAGDDFMATIDKKLIQRLRDITGLGMMDCKNALEQTGGDIEKAIEILRKKGAAVAAKRSDKQTAEGIIHAYIHPGSKLGVLVEVNCETDFVANTQDMKDFVHDLALHIAAMRPLYLSPADVDPKFLEHEREIFKEQLSDSGKPEKIINQIIEGKLKKLYSDICLLEQPFIKNDQFTVGKILQNLMGKTGENIRIKRFARYEIGT
jgi:elongation factor Ts